MWILVLTPPLERPNASRSGALTPEPAEFLSFDRAPCVALRRHKILQLHRCQALGRDVFGWLVPSARRVMMCPDHRGIHPHRPPSTFLDVAARPQPVRSPAKICCL